jgi:8-oxo-dGTP diphosphatase
VLVVAAAIVQAGRVLAAQRSYPAELADCWEFPGGKVEPGEKPTAALMREIREELGVDVAVHERLGDDVLLQLPKPVPGRLPAVQQRLGDDVPLRPARPVPGRLRLYRCSLSAPDAMPVAHEHARLRWVAAADLDALGWLGTNRHLLPLVRAALTM